jgi:hypothetical protein
MKLTAHTVVVADSGDTWTPELLKQTFPGNLNDQAEVIRRFTPSQWQSLVPENVKGDNERLVQIFNTLLPVLRRKSLSIEVIPPTPHLYRSEVGNTKYSMGVVVTGKINPRSQLANGFIDQAYTNEDPFEIRISNNPRSMKGSHYAFPYGVTIYKKTSLLGAGVYSLPELEQSIRTFIQEFP